MTALLYTTGILLAIVSGARSVLWLTSYASTPTDQALLTDARTHTHSQQSNADDLTAIGHNSKSQRINKDVEASIATRRQLLDELQRQQNTTTPATGTSAALLGDYRLILWLLLATLLDAAGMLCLRTAVADNATEHTEERESSDPLLEQIRDEIAAGQHGDKPAVIRVAEQHSLPAERIRQVFQTLVELGDLSRSGPRYIRTGVTA